MHRLAGAERFDESGDGEVELEVNSKVHLGGGEREVGLTWGDGMPSRGAGAPEREHRRGDVQAAGGEGLSMDAPELALMRERRERALVTLGGEHETIDLGGLGEGAKE